MMLASSIILSCVLPAMDTLPTLARQTQEGTPGAETLMLNEAISITVGGNRTLRNAELAVERAQEQTAALRTRFYPSSQFNGLISQPLTRFDFTVRQGQLGVYPTIGPVPAADTKFGSSMTPRAFINGQVNQPLTQLYRLSLNRRQLEIGEEIAAEDVRLSRQTLIADVKRVYLLILRNQTTIRSAEEAVKLYVETRRVTSEYVEQGAALRPSLFEVEARLAQAELNVLTLRDQAATLKEQLNQLLGRDVRTDFNVSPVSDMVAYTVNADGLKDAQDRALARRPEIRQAMMRVEQAALDRRAKRSEYIPDVSANFSYVSQFNFNEFLPGSFAGAGVPIQSDIFDWGRKRREGREKALAEEQVRNTLAETESAVLRDVAAKYRQLREAARTLAVIELTWRQARIRFARDVLSLAEFIFALFLLGRVLSLSASVTSGATRPRMLMAAFASRSRIC